MLGVRNYTQDYIDECRAKVAGDLGAYRSLVAAAKAGGDKTLTTAMPDFEATFFNNMVPLLDYFFVHRLRTVEGEDGDPLNEVRVLCDSILHNHNRMSADKAIKLSPARSVLKHQVGDEIRLSEADFLLLSKAFFVEVEKKYL